MPNIANIMDYHKLKVNELLAICNATDWARLNFLTQLTVLSCLQKQRVNNASTRRLMLQTILTEEDINAYLDTEKKKLKRILVHAWGQKQASILAAILAKAHSERNEKEQEIMEQMLGRFLGTQRQQKRLFAALQAVFAS